MAARKKVTPKVKSLSAKKVSSGKAADVKGGIRLGFTAPSRDRPPV